MLHQGSCESNVDDAHVEFQWVLLEIDCMEEMYKSSTKVIEAFVANVVAAWCGPECLKSRVTSTWPVTTVCFQVLLKY